ncbi:MAG: hypothetical protein CMD42_03735 [Gammaproteobacteria bacterium]|nr:hypothetical protein [Gammaproteobacteria bacterium]
MFYWLIYSLASFYIGYLLSKFFSGTFRIIFLCTFLVLMLTPAIVEVGSNKLAPAIIIFFLDLILEQNLSTRSLRPILLSIPFVLFLIGLCILVKKRFF